MICIKIYDCNLSYGNYVTETPFNPCPTINELSRCLKNAGITGGLIHNVMCDITGVVIGNKTVSEDIARMIDSGLDFWAVWALLPSCTREIPSPIDLPVAMARNFVGAIYMNPKAHSYLPRKAAIGDYLAMAQERKIPVILDNGYGLSMEDIYDVLEDFPDLTSIVNRTHLWPSGRMLYPLLEKYENLHLDTTNIWDDQGIEMITKRYGANRIVMGSGFPGRYLGGFLAYIRTAEISDIDKQLIFGGNLERLVRGANLK